MMRILFERSGGFIGLKTGLTVDLEEIPADKASTLRDLVEGSNFFSLAAKPETQPVPDGFRYKISVETELVQHTVSFTDVTAPDELRPLIQELTLMARSQRE